MKKLGFIAILILAAGILFAGCGRLKSETAHESEQAAAVVDQVEDLSETAEISDISELMEMGDLEEMIDILEIESGDEGLDADELENIDELIEIDELIVDSHEKKDN